MRNYSFLELGSNILQEKSHKRVYSSLEGVKNDRGKSCSEEQVMLSFLSGVCHLLMYHNFHYQGTCMLID